MNLKIHSMIPITEVNGPGKRFGIWLQGCSRKCPDCYNPEAQNPAGGYEMAVEDLYCKIISTPGIDGVSISGGEPLEQAEALIELASKIKTQTDLSILVFTAFSIEQLQNLPDLMPLIDCLVLNHKQDKEVPLRLLEPSVCFSDDLPQEVELHILENGDIQITGFPTKGEKELIQCFVSR
jgi:anaerobic ribonucleoside-triphosphate reductase activating protein